MDLEARNLGDYIAAIKYRRKLVFGLAFTVFGASLALAVLLPAVYRSTATILIEQPEIPAELVRSTISTNTEQRVEGVSRRVMTTENLSKLITKYNLYPDQIALGGMDAAANRMRTTDIQIEVVNVGFEAARGKVQPSIPFYVSYEATSATVAQQVASELADLYLAENLKTRTERAAEISSFLAEQAARLTKEVTEQEARLAEFKERNAGKLPELGALNIQTLDRIENELREVDRQMLAAESQRINLLGQLEQLEASGVPLTGRVMSPDQRLVEAQTEYYALLSKYSEGHPDVVRARKELDSLRGASGGGTDVGFLDSQLAQKRLELLSVQERYAQDHPDVRRLTNEIASIESQMRTAMRASASGSSAFGAQAVRKTPAYIEAQTAINRVDAEIRALRSKQGEAYAKRSSMEVRLSEAPQIEREYRELSRGYEASLAKLKDVQNKQIEAQLAENLESRQKGESFNLIEAAALPDAPVRPNRTAIVFLGLVFGLAAGIGAMLIADALDDTVRGSRGIAALLNAPPLAVIPVIDSRGDSRAAVSAAMSTVVGLLLAGVLLALIIGSASSAGQS